MLLGRWGIGYGWCKILRAQPSFDRVQARFFYGSIGKGKLDEILENVAAPKNRPQRISQWGEKIKSGWLHGGLQFCRAANVDTA